MDLKGGPQIKVTQPTKGHTDKEKKGPGKKGRETGNLTPNRPRGAKRSARKRLCGCGGGAAKNPNIPAPQQRQPWTGAGKKKIQ